jgi:hypothetical protein
MSAARRVRWECPAGKHPGVLGPTRPPKDAVARFCLPCSMETGRLVSRVAPALERERAAKTTRRAESARKSRERERERVEANRRIVVTEVNGESGVLNIDEVVRDILGLPEIREQRRLWGQPRPTVVVRRRPTEGVSGHAKVWRGEIVVTIGQGCSRERVEELLLHEVVHAVLHSTEAHGGAFRAALIRASREFWPGIVTPPNQGEVYAMDDLITEAAKTLRRWEAMA